MNISYFMVWGVYTLLVIMVVAMKFHSLLTPPFYFLLECTYNVEKIEEFHLKIYIDKISKVVHGVSFA